MQRRPRPRRLSAPSLPALALLTALALGACSTASGDDGGAAGSDQTEAASGATGGVASSEIDILAAAEATAAAGSGTATTRYLPGGDPDALGAHIATRFAGDDRDVSIAAIEGGAGYSGTGATEHELRLIGGQAYFRSIDLGDGWFAGTYRAPAEVFIGVPERYDPRDSPVAGMRELIVAAGPLTEIGPDHYQGQISLDDLRAVIAPPVSFTLLVDAAADLPDDTGVLLTFAVSGGMVSQASAEVVTPAVGDVADVADDLDDGYGQGSYGASVATTFVDLGSGGPIETPDAAEQLDA